MNKIEDCIGQPGESIQESNEPSFRQKQTNLIKRLSQHLDLAKQELAEIRVQMSQTQDIGSGVEKMWKVEGDRMAEISYTNKTIEVVRTLTTEEQLDGCERNYRDGLCPKVTKAINSQDLEYIANFDLTDSAACSAAAQHFSAVAMGDEADSYGDCCIP